MTSNCDFYEILSYNVNIQIFHNFHNNILLVQDNFRSKYLLN